MKLTHPNSKVKMGKTCHKIIKLIFLDLLESFRNSDKNNFNLNQFNDLACSISNFLTHSGIMKKDKLSEFHNSQAKKFDQPKKIKTTNTQIMEESKSNDFLLTNLKEESKPIENNSTDSLNLLKNSFCSLSFLNTVNFHQEESTQLDNPSPYSNSNSIKSNEVLNPNLFNESDDETNWDDLL